MRSSGIEDQREACFECGQSPNASVHGKAYGGGSYTARLVNGEWVTEIKTSDPSRAPWQHAYVPGTLQPR